VRTATLRDRIERVQANIAEAALRSGRDPAEVTLVAVSKTVERPQIDEAYHLGLRHFGENRVQDAARRFDPALPADAHLHMIGQLQSNKARQAVSLFNLIESVDRPSLVDALDKEAQRLGRPVSVLLQVNIAGEAQKAGCAPEQAGSLIALIQESSWLRLRGLMTIAPLVGNVEEVRPVFAGLRTLRDRLLEAEPMLPLDVLSMGMTDDYPVAIDEGATEVRIGRAIFQQ
jgi:pyridoxal phosphate enzyme (YggS family)